MNKNINYLLLILSLVILSNCGGKEKKTSSPRIRKLSKIVSPKYDAVFTLNDTLNFKIATLQDTVTIDSFIVKSKKYLIFNSKHSSKTARISKTGITNLSVEAYLSNGKKESHSLKITMLSDVKPDLYSYQKNNVYYHDSEAYTQGLIYEKDYFYESTGQNGASSLRKVEVSTGKVLKQIDLENQYFGEGIATLNDKIYMLTYKSRQGFVYNKNTFEQLETFNFATQTTEGWGITAIGDSLVMSDGSENLYYLNPETLALTSKIQVYDQYRPIKNLNELELVHGKIYANIYQSDEIAIINPLSGKLEGRINLTGIFNKRNYNKKIDVLNGIAYDKANGRLFVTGKWYPELYEIDIYKTSN